MSDKSLYGAKSLYDALYNQNQEIEKNNQKIKDKNSTDNQKNTYETPKTELLTTLNTAFLCVYFALLAVVAYQLAFTVKSNIYIRIIIAALFVIYPFISKPIFHYVSWMLRYLKAIIFGTAFTR